MSGIRYWVNNPDSRLFKEEDPNTPEWCAPSQPFVEWGDSLLARLAQDPVPGKIGYAKWKLLDRYMRLYHRTSDEHRPKKNHGRHHCIHEALLLIWQKLEDVEIQAAIPELEPPRLQLLPAPQPTPAVPQPEYDEPHLEEVSGIIIGIEEDEAEDEQGDTS